MQKYFLFVERTPVHLIFFGTAKTQRTPRKSLNLLVYWQLKILIIKLPAQDGDSLPAKNHAIVFHLYAHKALHAQRLDSQSSRIFPTSWPSTEQGSNALNP